MTTLIALAANCILAACVLGGLTDVAAVAIRREDRTLP